MGDTGSMVIGFILTFMAIRFLYISETSSLGLKNRTCFIFLFLLLQSYTLYRFLQSEFLEKEVLFRQTKTIFITSF